MIVPGRINILLIFATMDITATLQKFTARLSILEKEDIKKDLSVYLNYLLINDFSALVQILYRVDVSEQKIKAVLKENTEANAGDLLAELLLQRREEKTAARNSFPSADAPSNEERW